MTTILLFNKPFNVLSQFTDNSVQAAERQTLSDFVAVKGVYPAGRLDQDSEGLLVLTDNGRLQAKIADPRNKMAKTYWAQVEGVPGEAALEQLRRGVELKDGPTLPAEVRQMDPPNDLWPRNPPIRYRKNVADSWIELTIQEGRNRQVRRMTAAVGFPTLRLIRARIGDWDLAGLQPGEWVRV